MKSETIISKPMYSSNEEVINENVSVESFLNKNISEKIQNSRPYIVLLATFILMSLGIFLVYEFQPEFYQINVDRIKSGWGLSLLGVTAFLLLFKTCFFIYNLYLYFKYKPIKSVSNEELPTCTVIVPAYNEGKQVWETLLSLANSDYPEEKLQLLAIDDGSKDDTWYWMQYAKKQLGDRVSIYQQPKNMGKRHALYRGFKLGTGEVFVTVDSDSVVKPDTLKNLVLELSKSYACIMTVGGTGIGKRDITVDTLEPLLERKLDGLMEAARSFGQKRTPYAAMSRGVAGFIDRSLVVTLPGSRGGASESMAAILPALVHIFDVCRDLPHPGGYE